MTRLDTDFQDENAVPYFLWDDPMTVRELRERLRTVSEPERVRLMGIILREARDTDVWAWVSLEEVLRCWPQLRRHLGRRLAFWEFLLSRWRQQGLVHD
ncbi:MAG TPA: hypothetical protein VFZ09_42385 [Archangium sp.]|uniref:hypothetical protein n=1 Tax=Archangium sp. TaxID=1872627 RepID=UPI002E34FB51|nr:hypothetical protein [Archangium sp.]HEX5752928.1 hypothetical protein [Archangium sp.]